LFCEGGRGFERRSAAARVGVEEIFSRKLSVTESSHHSPHYLVILLFTYYYSQMQKRVFIIHGWDATPDYGWFPWLKKELENRGFAVTIPQLPNTEEPRINNWVPTVASVVGEPDEQTYFIGHSMGCQTIARYLETLPVGIKIGGVVFVAGFFKRLSGLEDDEIVRDVAKEWLETPLNLNIVAGHIKGSVAIFSDDDPYVPMDNQEEYRDILKSEIIIEHGKGHFSASAGTVELPVALDSLLRVSETK